MPFNVVYSSVWSLSCAQLQGETFSEAMENNCGVTLLLLFLNKYYQWLKEIQIQVALTTQPRLLTLDGLRMHYIILVTAAICTVTISGYYYPFKQWCQFKVRIPLLSPTILGNFFLQLYWVISSQAHLPLHRLYSTATLTIDITYK